MTSETSSRPSSERRLTREGALALVETGPEQRLPVLGEGPARVIESAADVVEADDVGAELGERHPAQGRGHVGGALHHGESIEHAGHGIRAISRQSRTSRGRSSVPVAVHCTRRRTSPPSARGSTPVTSIRVVQPVALEARAEVVAGLPGEDRRDVGQHARDPRGGDADHVAAVDESPATRAGPGVGMGVGEVERQPSQLGRRGDRLGRLDRRMCRPPAAPRRADPAPPRAAAGGPSPPVPGQRRRPARPRRRDRPLPRLPRAREEAERDGSPGPAGRADRRSVTRNATMPRPFEACRRATTSVVVRNVVPSGTGRAPRPR